MLVIEDSFAKWASQTLEAPHYYFGTLSPLVVLIGQCLKTFWAGMEMSMDESISWVAASIVQAGEVES